MLGILLLRGGGSDGPRTAAAGCEARRPLWVDSGCSWSSLFPGYARGPVQAWLLVRLRLGVGPRSPGPPERTLLGSTRLLPSPAEALPLRVAVPCPAPCSL